MSLTLVLVNEIKITYINKNNLGLKNREYLKINNNKIIKYNYSYSSSTSDPLNKTDANNRNNKSRIKIIKTLFKIVEIIRNNKPLNNNIYKPVYSCDELKIIKNKQEWTMDSETLIKIYTNASIKWKSESNFKENEYRFLLLTVIYERVIIKDIDSLLFCFWLYDQTNDKLFIH